jgi:hypothetical protein
MAFVVLIDKWKHGWELTVPGVGVTQCTDLADATTMAKDLIARQLDIRIDQIQVELWDEGKHG